MGSVLQLVSAPAFVVVFADTLGTAVASARLGPNWAEAMYLPPQPTSKVLLQLPSSPTAFVLGPNWCMEWNKTQESRLAALQPLKGPHLHHVLGNLGIVNLSGYFLLSGDTAFFFFQLL